MQSKNTLFLKALLSLLCALSSLGIVTGQSYDSVAVATNIEYLKKGIRFELDKKSLKQFFNTSTKTKAVEFSIPFFDEQELVLELIPIQIHKDNFVVTEKNQQGEFVSAYELGSYFMGQIKGDPESAVTLAIQEEEISGLIFTGGRKINFGKLKNSSQHILYDSKDLDEEVNFSCSSLPSRDAANVDLTQAVKSSGCTTAVEIYIECDYQMYQNHGSNSATVTNYVNSLFTEVATLYANENIIIQLSQVTVWSSNDGYASGSGGLTSFATALNSSGFNGDLAMLLTNDTGSNGGVAYVDQLCGSNPYAYCDILNSHSSVPTYSWDVQVVAHEMGHNFGSSHTHDCVWGPNGNEQIDDCGSQVLGGGSCYDPSNPIIPTNGGTIMSYCHINSTGINFNKGFGALPGDLIRSKHSTCMCDNSTCDQALLISSPGTYSAQPSSGNGASNSSASHADWFEFVPVENGTISLYSCNEGVDTRVFLHSGSCNSLSYLTMSDDDCTSSGSATYASEIIDQAVTNGVSYYIEWDSRWSTAAFDWEMEFTAAAGGGSMVNITCPQDFIGTNTCSTSNYNPNVTGYATSSAGSNVTYTDAFNNTSCTVVIDRTWTATDSNGNTATCSQYIDLDDTTPPVISNCPNTINVTSDVNCQAVVSWSAPIGTDNCTSVSVTSTHSSGSQFAVGSYSVFYYFSDTCNNTANCAFTINVADGCSSGGGSGTLDPCDATNMTLNGNILSDTYNAEILLGASGTVQSTANPIFKAGQEIDILPGFELQLGATLEALIEDCQN